MRRAKLYAVSEKSTNFLCQVSFEQKIFCAKQNMMKQA